MVECECVSVEFVHSTRETGGLLSCTPAEGQEPNTVINVSESEENQMINVAGDGSDQRSTVHMEICRPARTRHA